MVAAILLNPASSTSANLYLIRLFSSIITKGTGFKVWAVIGILTPFIDYAYVDESTTSATYRTSLATKDTASTDLTATSSDGYTSFGGGIMINLRNRLTGTISYYDISGRDDYNEDTLSATLRLKF